MRTDGGAATVIGGETDGRAAVPVPLTEPVGRSGRNSLGAGRLPGTELETSTTMMNGAPRRSSSINCSRMDLTDDSIFHRHCRPVDQRADVDQRCTKRANDRLTVLKATIHATSNPCTLPSIHLVHLKQSSNECHQGT